MTTLTAQRDADRRYTFSPSSGFTFADLTPLMKIWVGEGGSETPALVISLTPTANGSAFVPYSSSQVLTLEKADLAALPDGDLYYDITLTDGTGFENALCGGSFDLVEDGSEKECKGCGGVITFDANGQRITVVLQGGNLAIGASVALSALNAAVAAADAAAASAAASAASVAGIPVAFAAPTGSGLIGYIATGVGAIARTILAKLRGWPDVKDFGAVGNGVADDTAAFAAAGVAGLGSHVFVPTGTYNVTGWSPPLATRFHGAGVLASVIKKTANGDFGTMGDGAQLVAIGVDLQGATYTGKGFSMSGGNQVMRDVAVINGADYCIYFPNGTGSRFHADNVRAYRANAVPGDGKHAIGFENVLQASGQTTWNDLKTDGLDSVYFGGANNALITNSAIYDCEFPGNNRDVCFSNCRMAGVTPYVLRGSGSIMGGGIAPNLTIAAGGVWNVNPAFTNNEIYDNSGGTSIVNQHKIQAYVPVLKAGGVPITLGTGGSYTGRYSRSGKLVNLNVRVIGGTGATIPAGALTITLPTGAVGADLVQWCVHGMYQPTSGVKYLVGGTIPAGGSEATLEALSGSAFVVMDNATPSAFGDGTGLYLTFSYQT